MHILSPQRSTPFRLQVDAKTGEIVADEIEKPEEEADEKSNHK